MFLPTYDFCCCFDSFSFRFLCCALCIVVCVLFWLWMLAGCYLFGWLVPCDCTFTPFMFAVFGFYAVEFFLFHPSTLLPLVYFVWNFFSLLFSFFHQLCTILMCMLCYVFVVFRFGRFVLGLFTHIFCRKKNGEMKIMFRKHNICHFCVRYECVCAWSAK